MVFRPGSLTSLCNLIPFNTGVNKRERERLKEKIRWTEQDSRREGGEEWMMKPRNDESEEEASESRKTGETEEWLERIVVTPLPSAASAAAVHTTNKGLSKDVWMLVVTNGYKRDVTTLEEWRKRCIKKDPCYLCVGRERGNSNNITFLQHVGLWMWHVAAGRCAAVCILFICI